ncbi:MAG: S-layer homology domain-containing protein, partial [Oscillospiraceae bacterium]|nr:S-layer homology domain-containing protein [Oscillospiraceae bacterium]
YIVEELDAVIGAEYAEPQGRITIHEHFDDVTSQEQYYYDPVYWAVAHDPQITAGIGSNLFGPDVDCTREMVVTFLWKAYGGEIVEEGKAAGFSDVPEDAYFVNAVRWAVAKGVTGGVGDGKFGVGQVCTRAEVVTFLWAAAGKPKPKTAESPFTDVKEGDWFLSPVLWAVENGVTGGTGDGQFSPAMTCTRAQIVTFLYKAMQLKPELCFPSASNDDIAKYGNIYTNYEGADFFAEGYTWGDIVTVKFLDWELELPIVPTFSYVDSGTPGVFVNKDGETGEPTGRMFMAINMGSFAEAYGLAIKTTNPDKTYFWTPVEGVEFPVPVTVEMKEAGGYLMEMNIRDINRTNNREDYPALTDEEFANFRRITTTGMGDHLYRGSSPINPEIGRNTYADAALENAGVTVVMNLANSQADAEAYPGFAESYYAGQNVIYLNLGVDFFAEEFKTGLAAGLRHFAENEGVYYVHCTEGKDRAGFVSALLECFMGASCDEVVADYLKTYTNYYNVVDGVQQPLSEETLNAIAESNIIRTLQRAFAVEDLTSADLAAEAEEYLSELGLNAEELAALRTNLGGETQQPTSSYAAAESVEAGDQILYVVEYGGKHYAMTNDTTSINSAFGAAEVTLEADGSIAEAPAGALWTLENGSAAGRFLLKDEAGLYVSNPSGTTL